MSIDIHEIAELWKVDRPKFLELGEIVSSFIKSNITECELLPEVTYRTKELLSIIKKIKKKQTEKDYTYSHLNDKLGIRIICTFQDEMEKIDTFLNKYLIIRKAEYKQENLNFDKLDYISNHYDASIKTQIKQFSMFSHYEDLVFEIQVRTLNQHAWSNASHSLSYKQEAEISSALKRRVYRLLSLYEIADDEFSAVNKALKEHPDNLAYLFLRKLEGKIYKYAQVDFDRTTSLSTIKILLSYFKDEQRSNIYNEIENFISINNNKIVQIFNENRIRYFEIPFLTQPEIFIVWYGLEKYSFSIEDNWANDFESFELEQIKTLWG